MTGALFLSDCVLCRLTPFADKEPGEPGDRDILSGSCVDGHDDVADGLGVVLDELLIEKHALREPGVELAVGDFLLHVGGFVADLGHEDSLLFGDDLLRDVLAADEERVGGQDVQGQVLRQVLELIVAGDEIGLAIQLDQAPDLAS